MSAWPTSASTSPTFIAVSRHLLARKVQRLDLPESTSPMMTQTPCCRLTMSAASFHAGGIVDCGTIVQELPGPRLISRRVLSVAYMGSCRGSPISLQSPEQNGEQKHTT